MDLVTMDRLRTLDGFGCPVIIMGIDGYQGTGPDTGDTTDGDSFLVFRVHLYFGRNSPFLESAWRM